MRVVALILERRGGFIVLLGRSTTSAMRTRTACCIVGVAIVVGVGGVFFLYWVMNRAVDFLPARFREGVRPYVFVGPALVILRACSSCTRSSTRSSSAFKDAQGE